MKSQPIFRINRLQIGLERKPGIATANSKEEDNQQKELMGKTLKNAWDHMEIQVDSIQGGEDGENAKNQNIERSTTNTTRKWKG
jgi:hypothetical protein